MKKTSVVILIFILTGCGYKYQRTHSKFTEQEIIKRANFYFGLDFSFNNTRNEYIVDGKNIGIDDFRLLLEKYKEGEYRKVDFEKKSCKTPSIDFNCGITIRIDTKLTQQSDNEKREILERNKRVFDNGIPEMIIRDREICPECKLVFLDYQPYEKRDAQKILNEINLEEIEYIAEYEKPMNPEIFGTSGIGQAGWIQIWKK